MYFYTIPDGFDSELVIETNNTYLDLNQYL